MKFIQAFFLAILSLGIFSSCSPTLTPFTQNLYEDQNWSQEELKRIQFYVSRDIVLYRSYSGSASTITNGRIILKDGKKIEEVIIKNGTPGVIVFIPKQNRFAISFEENGGNDEFLMFGPNPKLSDRYALLAKDWEQRGGKVTYAGELFNVNTESALASLMVDMNKIGETKVQRKVAGGRTVK